MVSPAQRKLNTPTSTFTDGNKNLLRVKTGNITKCNVIEKGITTLTIGKVLRKAIKKYYSGVKFDLILYSTPPITYVDVISYFKKRDNAKSYLLLKDIFPQNAVDIGMMSKKGIKSVIYKVFRNKEEKLYKVSDYIGCMSEANVRYLLDNNPYVPSEIVHVNPNTISVTEDLCSEEKKVEIKNKYNIPLNATTFIYGGNLGKPQDIPFVIECLKANAEKKDRYFIICGTGTEYPKLKAYIDEYKPSNVLLINGLPKNEYEDFVKAFDVGLVFLDHRFTIPNFPSRILSYMRSKMPVLACTDINTDIGDVIENGGFGWSCESNSTDDFVKTVDEAINSDLKMMGEKGFEFLCQNYTVERSYKIIVDNVTKAL